MTPVRMSHSHEPECPISSASSKRRRSSRRLFSDWRRAASDCRAWSDIEGVADPGHDRALVIGERRNTVQERSATERDVHGGLVAEERIAIRLLERGGHRTWEDFVDRLALNHLLAQPDGREPMSSGRQVVQAVVEHNDDALGNPRTMGCDPASRRISTVCAAVDPSAKRDPSTSWVVLWASTIGCHAPPKEAFGRERCVIRPQSPKGTSIEDLRKRNRATTTWPP
jgi:hypothetical protein